MLDRVDQPSHRLSSVWSDSGRRQVRLSRTSRPASGSTSTAVASQETQGLSPESIKMETTRSKRREAANWMEKITGAMVACDSDSDFRASLADGTVLCKIANLLCPDAIKV